MTQPLTPQQEADVRGDHEIASVYHQSLHPTPTDTDPWATP